MLKLTEPQRYRNNIKVKNIICAYVYNLFAALEPVTHGRNLTSHRYAFLLYTNF